MGRKPIQDLLAGASGSDNPYIPNADLWNDMIGSVLRENRTLRFSLAGLALVCIGILVLCGMLITSKRVYVGAMVIDRANAGSKVYALNSIDEATTGKDPALRDVLARYFMARFIESLYTVSDLDADERNAAEDVRPYIALPSPAAEYIKAYYQQFDPAVRAQQMRIAIQVDPISDPRRANEYLVGWTAVTHDLHGTTISTRHYTALVDIRWDAQTNVNPAGFKIVQITPNQDITVPGPSQGNGQ